MCCATFLHQKPPQPSISQSSLSSEGPGLCFHPSQEPNKTKTRRQKKKNMETKTNNRVREKILKKIHCLFNVGKKWKSLKWKSKKNAFGCGALTPLVDDTGHAPKRDVGVEPAALLISQNRRFTHCLSLSLNHGSTQIPLSFVSLLVLPNCKFSKICVKLLCGYFGKLFNLHLI